VLPRWGKSIRGGRSKKSFFCHGSKAIETQVTSNLHGGGGHDYSDRKGKGGMRAPPKKMKKTKGKSLRWNVGGQWSGSGQRSAGPTDVGPISPTTQPDFGGQGWQRLRRRVLDPGKKALSCRKQKEVSTDEYISKSTHEKERDNPVSWWQ